MKVLRRWFGVDQEELEHARVRHEVKMAKSDVEVAQARAALHQKIQRVERKNHIFGTTSGAMRIIRNAHGENNR